MLTLNKLLNEKMAVLTPVILLAGILAGSRIDTWTAAVPWLFMAITFIGSLNIHPRDLKKELAAPKPLIICLINVNIIVPLAAFIIAYLIMPPGSETLTGVFLAFLIPVAVASVLWVTIYEGNSPLALSIIFINTCLSPLYIPLMLYLFLNISVGFAFFEIGAGLFQMIVIPSAAGILLNYFSVKKTFSRLVMLQIISKCCLLTVIFINGSVAAPYFIPLDPDVLILTLIILVISIAAYMIAYISSRISKLAYKETIAVFFCSGMRNIGAGSALAVIFFPAAVAVPVVVGTLFQQVLASLMGKMMISRKTSGE